MEDTASDSDVSSAASGSDSMHSEVLLALIRIHTFRFGFGLGALMKWMIDVRR